jgi:hypothetical protein
METMMRKITIATTTIMLVVAAVALIQSYTGAAQSPRMAMSAFDLMSEAANLPVAPNPDAF